MTSTRSDIIQKRYYAILSNTFWGGIPNIRHIRTDPANLPELAQSNIIMLDCYFNSREHGRVYCSEWKYERGFYWVKAETGKWKKLRWEKLHITIIEWS